MQNNVGLFKQKSHYISWNFLFLWGFGLWIALCTSNMYHSDILVQQAIFFYQQNMNFGVTYNVSTKPEPTENTLHIMGTNHPLSNMILMLRAMLKYINIFVFLCFVILPLCIQEHIRKRTELWKNIGHDSFSIVSYFNSIMRKHKENNIFNKKNDHVLQLKLFVNSENNMKHISHYNQTKNQYILTEKRNKNMLNTNITIIQKEIVFHGYTLLLFNNYTLYRYFNNQQFKITYNLLTQYSTVQDSECIHCDIHKSNGKFNNFALKKGIISSSPEFKKFLKNLKKSPFFYPFILEVSTSYIISIKSIYN